MSIDMLVNHVVKFFSWLFYRQWATWEILTIVLMVLLIRLLIGSSQQKARIKASHQHDYPSIIGKNLIDSAQKY